MSTPQEQVEHQMQQQRQRQQAIQQRMSSAIKGGLDFLQDEAVVAPIKHADGIVDLKWMLRTIASGEFGIDTDPGRRQREAQKPTPDTPPPGADKDKTPSPAPTGEGGNGSGSQQ